MRVLDLFVRLTGPVTFTGAQRLPAGGALLVANHVSWLDPIVLLVTVHRATDRRLRFVALPSLFKVPVVGFFMRAGRHIPAHDGPRARSTLAAAVAAVQAGELVLVYPQGAIVADGEGHGAMPGFGVLAARAAGGTLIPLASTGLERRDRWWAGRRPARVAVGDPVALPAGGTPRERRERLGALAVQAVDELHRRVLPDSPGPHRP